MRTAPVALATLLLLVPASSAAATPGGSDDPTPYTVTAQTLTLPHGATFQDGDHVNVRFTVGGETRQKNLHVEAQNGQPSARYVGQSSLAWRDLTGTDTYCITWVQVGDYNEHFGEGGQEPVCTEDTPATPVTRDAPGPDESPNPEPSPETSTPSGDATPGNPAPAAPTPAGTPAASPSASASPVSAAVPSPSASPSTAVAEGSDGPLASTGATALPLLLGAGALILAGAALVVFRLRARRASGK